MASRMRSNHGAVDRARVGFRGEGSIPCGSVTFYPDYVHVSEIDTPALVVDLDIFERNLQRVANYAREHELRLRPHTKTHKAVWIGRRQLDLGAAGLTCAKVTEAEVMMGAMPHDLLLAYPILGRVKLDRLMQIARGGRA